MNELEKNEIVSKLCYQAPLKDGVLICKDSKSRVYEFVSILDVAVPNATERGIKEGTTIGAYLKGLEASIKSLNSRFDKLCDIVENINSKPKKAE